MAQLVTRVNDRLVAQIDDLGAKGAVASRSEAVRVGLERLVHQHRRRETGAKTVQGYRRHPQTDDELAGLDQATRALIAEDPW